MGRRRRAQGRRVDGILLLDKGLGLSSNAALQDVKRLFRARKAGHTGSLDPLASGMLPICFGEATKLSGFLLDADKSYRVTATLGAKSSTGDAEGEIIERKSFDQITEKQVLKVLEGFHGTVSQIPPMYSAVKHEGKRLYELAREGVEVERKSREIVIHELSLTDFRDDSLQLELRCSKGTYVRTLVEDIAEAMGTVAHVSSLRRLHVGPFQMDGMMTFEALEKVFRQDESLEMSERQALLDENLLPIDSALGHWPAVNLDADSAYYIQRGQAVQVPKSPTEGLVRLYDPTERFLGVGEVQDDGRIGPRRLMQDRQASARSQDS